MRGDRRWRGVQVAIGDHVGEDTLNVMAHPEYSSFRSRVTENINPSDTVVERLRVPVQTLESIIEDMHLESRLPVTLLKSNTQGHELSVLQGLGKYLHSVKLIQCELFSIPLYKDSPLMTEILAFLYEHHFKAVSFAPVNGESVRPLAFDCLCVSNAGP
jgi:FkbM family methyltransferase